MRCRRSAACCARAAERATLLAVSGCFALYALVAAALAFAVPAAVRRLGAGTVHGCGLLIGAAGLVTLGLAGAAWPLVPAFLAVSVGWACIANIPYALASAAAPPGRGARTLRLFGFSTVAPQIVVSLTLALGASTVFGAATAPVMLLGGVMMAGAGLLALAWRRALDLPLAEW